MEEKTIVWSELRGQFLTYPDGEIATHRDIKENMVHKNEIRKLINSLIPDIEKNELTKKQIKVDSDGFCWSSTMICYDPEIVKAVLENLL